MLATVAELLSSVAERPYLVIGIVQTAALGAASLLLLYPVYAYAQNVAYTEGVVGLAIGLFLVTVANLLSFVPEATARSAVPVVSLHPLVWTSIVNLVAGVAATVGVYCFAREFLPTADGGVGTLTTDDEGDEETAGGFEAAGDGGADGDR